MAKVAFVIPALHGGGAEFVAGQWAAELHSLGHDVSLVTTHAKADGLPHSGPQHVPLANRGSFIRRIRDLRSLIVRENFDVVMALMPHWNVLAVLATCGMGPGRPRLVISGRNMDSSLKRSMGLRNRVELVLARLLYRRADAFIAISHPVAAEAITAYRLEPSRVWVVPNPATGKIDRSVAREERARRSEGEEDSTDIDIVVPARLVAQKRPTLAIDVAAEIGRLTDRDLNARVHYFGSGPLEKQVADAAVNRGVEAQFHGWVEDWFSKVPARSVMLLSSHSEGFGNVLVEAAAFGVPVVASSRALGVADAIVPGVTGTLCPGDLAADFAGALIEAARITVPVELEGWLDYFSPTQSTSKLWSVFSALGVEGASPDSAIARCSSHGGCEQRGVM